MGARRRPSTSSTARWLPGTVLSVALIVATVPASPGNSAGAGARAPTGTPEPTGLGDIDYFFVSSPHSRPFRITPGPDGNLWFTNTDSDMVGKITPDGEITQYPIGEGKLPYDIVAGRDGNLWFTENLNNKTGAVDTEGRLVHEYFAPGIDARPAGITSAPNGDIWWMNSGSGLDPQSEVSRLTPDGTVTNYELAPCACFGIGITTGPDGFLWGVEELGVYQGDSPGTLDRISQDGQSIVRFPIPAPPFTEQHLPAWNAPGPDGRVWFTELNQRVHQVGAVTHDGTITEYALPGSPSGTGSVTTGVDGRIWVTEPDANRVAVLRPDGSFAGSAEVHQQPMGITIGPDGNMWFVASLSGEIGRIRTARAGVVYVLDLAPGFVPAERLAPLGSVVQWVLQAPGLHEVEDATGLGLYDSGPRPPVSFHRHRFTAAGTYPYVDPQTGDAGAIAVPVEAPPTARIGRPFDVTWAKTPPPPGLLFDVQVRPPGSTEWLTWKSGVSDTSGELVPTAPGAYGFRARVRTPDATAGTEWSPPRAVRVA